MCVVFKTDLWSVSEPNCYTVTEWWSLDVSAFVFNGFIMRVMTVFDVDLLTEDWVTVPSLLFIHSVFMVLLLWWTCVWQRSVSFDTSDLLPTVLQPLLLLHLCVKSVCAFYFRYDVVQTTFILILLLFSTSKYDEYSISSIYIWTDLNFWTVFVFVLF